MTIELTESELEDIIFCLDARANASGVAKEWQEIYKSLAEKLQKKLN